jgi:hypothetical protein
MRLIDLHKEWCDRGLLPNSGLFTPSTLFGGELGIVESSEMTGVRT